MNFWWVNQKQTYRHEVPGGYMWSPKLDQSGNRNHSYDLMRKIQPGDLVFSYANALVKAVGVVGSHCYEFPKPDEFGLVGDYWSHVGWRIDVKFTEFPQPVRTIDHIAALRPFLADKHAPIQKDTGKGNQAYLFSISRELALALSHLLDRWVVDLVSGRYVLDANVDRSWANIEEWENRVENGIISDPSIVETVKETLVLARRGQGAFREGLFALEKLCRITKVDNPKHLIASHTKPWRDCDNEERLNPENGFLLTPTVDHLFDKGFISFENNGDLIISPVAHKDSLHKMSIPIDERFNVGSFSSGQKEFLDWHRNSLLLV